MGIELTSFETLTLPYDHPLRVQMREQGNEVRVDFTTEGFVRPELGRLGLLLAKLEEQTVEMPEAA